MPSVPSPAEDYLTFLESQFALQEDVWQTTHLPTKLAYSPMLDEDPMPVEVGIFDVARWERAEQLLVTSTRRPQVFGTSISDIKAATQYLTYRVKVRSISSLVKRGSDIACAVSGLLFLAPVLLLITAVVKASTPGPVLYGQKRVGLRGESFRLLKFRTMHVSTNEYAPTLADGGVDGILFTRRNDVRVTSVGRFLRRFSLDELPQLVNVLLGDMSLVGPRPLLFSEYERYGSRTFMQKHLLLKPGITGIWAIDNRFVKSRQEVARQDARYIEHWSLAIDVYILLKTMAAVFR